MADLKIKLLGCFQINLDDQPLIEAIPDKGRALLAFLMLEAERSHRRDALAEMLWPNQSHPNARTNLRQCLLRLRRYLDMPSSSPTVLFITPKEIQFNRNCNYWLDVAEFNLLLDIADIHHQGNLILCEACLLGLQRAAGLYQGDLLAGFSLPNCPAFDWWLFAKVEEYHRYAMFLLDRLVIHFKQNSDYYASCHYAQRAIDLEPWRERSYRMKMRALALSGNPGAAIRQYETCRKILMEELGIEPSSKTKNLLEQIQMGRVNSLSNLQGEYPLMEPLTV